MIQRIQHLWLFLASIITGCQFLTDYYHTDNVIMRVHDNYALFILTILLSLLPLITIFMYKKRGNQRSMVWLSMVLNAAFLALILMYVSKYNGSSAPQNGTYWIGSVIPIVSFILLIAALRGIRRDEKLIKSLDRLR